MDSSLDLRRQLLPPGYTAEYRMQFALQAARAPMLADRLLSDLIPRVALLEEDLRDLQGHDPEAPSAPIAPAWQPRGEELFFAAGKVTIDSIRSDSPRPPAEEFTVAVHTSFLAFEGNHHIKHGAKESRARSLPAYVPLRALGRVFPLQLTALRTGLEIFESRRFLASLGFSPVVTQTLRIEWYDGTAYLRVTAEGLKEREQLPLQRDNLAGKLDELTAELCGVAWSEDYARRVRRGG